MKEVCFDLFFLSFSNKQELSNPTRIIQKSSHIYLLTVLIKKLFEQVHKQFEYLIAIHSSSNL